MKSCTACQQPLTLEAFYKDKRHSDGLMSRCKECHKRVCYEWTQKNPDKERQKFRRYRLRHPAMRRAENASRRAARIKGLPSWLTVAQRQVMKDFYQNCPENYEVDHIVPLRGKSVNGLHVPWNLQYLPKEKNRRKSNKL